MSANKTDKILVLLGPTAVGKTEISLSIAEKFSCEIIGVDSMQVYTYMDIGTAKQPNRSGHGSRIILSTLSIRMIIIPSAVL